MPLSLGTYGVGFTNAIAVDTLGDVWVAGEVGASSANTFVYWENSGSPTVLPGAPGGQKGTPQDVQNAINKGAKVNTRGKGGLTPLMLAAGFNENPDVIATLLHAGANVNAQNKDGMTALTWAAEYNPNSMVTHMLISAGANVETRTIGLSQTALMLAAAYTSNPEVVTILLDAGAAGKH